MKLDGTAHVTWSLADPSRRVQHDFTWTRIVDGRTGHGTGDRTQRPLAGGLLEGIRIDGARSWMGKAGQWDLAIKGVEARWADPVPQAGSYVLGAPGGKSLSLSFARVDIDTIKVTIASGGREFSFSVNKLGGASQT